MHASKVAREVFGQDDNKVLKCLGAAVGLPVDGPFNVVYRVVLYGLILKASGEWQFHQEKSEVLHVEEESEAAESAPIPEDLRKRVDAWRSQVAIMQPAVMAPAPASVDVSDGVFRLPWCSDARPSRMVRSELESSPAMQRKMVMELACGFLELPREQGDVKATALLFTGPKDRPCADLEEVNELTEKRSVHFPMAWDLLADPRAKVAVKMDVKSAYRLIQFAYEDACYCGVWFAGIQMKLVWTRASFGGKQFPFWWSDMFQFKLQVVDRRLESTPVSAEDLPPEKVQMMDDVALPDTGPMNCLSRTIEWLEESAKEGVLWSLDKCFLLPASTLKFLGVLVDLRFRVIRLSPTKVAKAMEMVRFLGQSAGLGEFSCGSPRPEAQGVTAAAGDAYAILKEWVPPPDAYRFSVPAELLQEPDARESHPSQSFRKQMSRVENRTLEKLLGLLSWMGFYVPILVLGRAELDRALHRGSWTSGAWASLCWLAQALPLAERWAVPRFVRQPTLQLVGDASATGWAVRAIGGESAFTLVDPLSQTQQAASSGFREALPLMMGIQEAIRRRIDFASVIYYSDSTVLEVWVRKGQAQRCLPLARFLLLAASVGLFIKVIWTSRADAIMQEPDALSGITCHSWTVSPSIAEQLWAWSGGWQLDWCTTASRRWSPEFASVYPQTLRGVKVRQSAGDSYGFQGESSGVAWSGKRVIAIPPLHMLPVALHLATTSSDFTVVLILRQQPPCSQWRWSALRLEDMASRVKQLPSIAMVSPEGNVPLMPGWRALLITGGCPPAIASFPDSWYGRGYQNVSLNQREHCGPGSSWWYARMRLQHDIETNPGPGTPDGEQASNTLPVRFWFGSLSGSDTNDRLCMSPSRGVCIPCLARILDGVEDLLTSCPRIESVVVMFHSPGTCPRAPWPVDDRIWAGVTQLLWSGDSEQLGSSDWYTRLRLQHDIESNPGPSGSQILDFLSPAAAGSAAQMPASEVMAVVEGNPAVNDSMFASAPLPPLDTLSIPVQPTLLEMITIAREVTASRRPRLDPSLSPALRVAQWQTAYESLRYASRVAVVSFERVMGFLAQHEDWAAQIYSPDVYQVVISRYLSARWTHSYGLYGWSRVTSIHTLSGEASAMSAAASRAGFELPPRGGPKIARWLRHHGASERREHSAHLPISPKQVLSWEPQPAGSHEWYCWAALVVQCMFMLRPGTVHYLERRHLTSLLGGYVLRWRTQHKTRRGRGTKSQGAQGEGTTLLVSPQCSAARHSVLSRVMVRLPKHGKLFEKVSRQQVDSFFASKVESIEAPEFRIKGRHGIRVGTQIELQAMGVPEDIQQAFGWWRRQYKSSSYYGALNASLMFRITAKYGQISYRFLAPGLYEADKPSTIHLPRKWKPLARDRLLPEDRGVAVDAGGLTVRRPVCPSSSDSDSSSSGATEQSSLESETETGSSVESEDSESSSN